MSSGCLDPAPGRPDYSQCEYIVRVLILSSESGTAQEVSGHFRQSWNLNTVVSIHSDVSTLEFEAADCIYVTADYMEAAGTQRKSLCRGLEKAARNGAVIYFEPLCIFMDGIESAGIQHASKCSPIKTKPMIRSFPNEMTKFSIFFRQVFAEPVCFPRTHYEKTHMPGFVVTASDPPIWEIDFSADVIDADVLATTGRGQPLMTWKTLGKGGFLWSFDFSRRHELLHGKKTMRDFSLGYPDPDAQNFHYAGAGLDYMFRNLLVNLAAKKKYGVSLERVPGPNGAPCCSWQNHLDGYDNWEKKFAKRWAEILLGRGLIPSFTIRSDLTKFERPEFSGQEALASEFVRYCRRKGIPINPHLTLEPLDTPDIERDRILTDLTDLIDIGVARDEISGADHHVFYTRAQPVWQSFHSIINAGLYHDFGGATLSNFVLFPWFFCTSSAYAPYCPFFMLEDDEGHFLPLVIGSPMPSRPTDSAVGSRCRLPMELRLPVTYYFHPEFILDAVGFDDLHSEFQAMITDMEVLRDRHGYCMVTEPQAARAHIANRTARIKALISGRTITIEADGREAFEQAAEFRKALGMRIEYVSAMIHKDAYETTSPVRYISPLDNCMEISLNPSGKTVIGEGVEERFHFERINLPFHLDVERDRMDLHISEPGLRWIRYSWNPDDKEVWLPLSFPGNISIFNSTIELSNTDIDPLKVSFSRFSGEELKKQLIVLHGKLDALPIDPSVRILDFGTTAVRSMYGRGWCLIDEGSVGRTVTWSTGYPFSELKIPMNGGSGFNCEIELCPYVNSNFGSQTFAVEINDETVLEPVELKNEWQTISFVIPRNILFPGLNYVVFRYKYVSVPGLDQPGSRDMRPLAVMFDSMTLSKRKES